MPTNDYLNALRTVDAFAWAWAHRDAVAGAKTVAPALRAKVGASQLTGYFVGTSSPQHWAFEIGSGSLIQHGMYRFPVRLYEYLFAGGGFTQSTIAVPITVVQGGDGNWRVTNLR